ncbi:hypothetical protein ACR2XN_28265 [Klebsiella pneumoniae]
MRELPFSEYERIKEQAQEAFKEKFLYKPIDHVKELREEVKTLKEANVDLAGKVDSMGNKLETATTLLTDTMVAIQLQLSQLLPVSDSKPKGEENLGKWKIDPGRHAFLYSCFNLLILES